MKRLWIVRKGKAKLFTHLFLYEDATKPLTTVLPVVTIQFWIQNLSLDLNSSVPRAHTQTLQKHRKTGPFPQQNYFHNPLLLKRNIPSEMTKNTASLSLRPKWHQTFTALMGKELASTILLLEDEPPDTPTVNGKELNFSALTNFQRESLSVYSL